MAPVSAAEIDDRLVDGIRERSNEAFAAVYRSVASDLLSFAAAMLHDRGAAEDAVQQAFLELARSATQIRGDGRSLRAWLFRSVRYRCMDELRRRRRHPEYPTERLPEPLDNPVDEFLDPDLQRALAGLTERQRAIMVLRYVVDAPISDIARILRTNRSAVYAASTRAELAVYWQLLGEDREANELFGLAEEEFRRIGATKRLEELALLRNSIS